MIKTADTAEAIKEVCDFMVRFESATEFVKVVPDHAFKVYESMIKSGTAIMLVLEEDGQMVGGLGAIKYPDLHSGELTAVETYWFVAPEHRGHGMELFEAFEQWGKDQECTRLAMIHLADSYPKALEKIYLRKGYQLVEKHYVRIL